MKTRFISTILFITIHQMVLSQTLSNELHPSWSPSGDRIALYSDATGNNEIYTISIATGERKQLTSNGSNNENPVWSPAGDYIAFHSNHYGSYDIMLVKPDGSDMRRLTNNPQREMSPSWSPNGQEIVFEVDTSANWQLFKFNITTNQTQQLTFKKKDHLAAAWDNSGENIYYGSSYRGAHQTDVEIYRLNLTDKSDTPITYQSGVSSNVVFSQSNSKLLFNTKRDGNWEIYIMQLDGSDPVRLTTNTNQLPDFPFSDIDGQPSYSTDGNRVAFISGRKGNFDIFTMMMDTKQLTCVTCEWVN